MEMETVLEVLKYLGIIVLGGLSIYFKYNKDLQQKFADITAQAVILIKEAEYAYADLTNAGGEKFNYVVDNLYGLVPETLRYVITRETIEDIVQRTFDAIEEYSVKKLNEATGTETTTDEVVEEVAEEVEAG